MTMLLILILATTPVLASACSGSCALSHATENHRLNADNLSMDTDAMASGDCEHMRALQDHHDPASQDKQQDQHAHCTMAGCHLAMASTPLFVKQSFVANGPDHLPLHFGAFARSAELPPPIKPPA